MRLTDRGWALKYLNSQRHREFGLCAFAIQSQRLFNIIHKPVKHLVSTLNILYLSALSKMSSWRITKVVGAALRSIVAALLGRRNTKRENREEIAEVWHTPAPAVFRFDPASYCPRGLAGWTRFPDGYVDEPIPVTETQILCRRLFSEEPEDAEQLLDNSSDCSSVSVRSLEWDLRGAMNGTFTEREALPFAATSSPVAELNGTFSVPLGALDGTFNFPRSQVALDETFEFSTNVDSSSLQEAVFWTLDFGHENSESPLQFPYDELVTSTAARGALNGTFSVSEEVALDATFNLSVSGTAANVLSETFSFPGVGFNETFEMSSTELANELGIQEAVFWALSFVDVPLDATMDFSRQRINVAQGALNETFGCPDVASHGTFDWLDISEASSSAARLSLESTFVFPETVSSEEHCESSVGSWESEDSWNSENSLRVSWDGPTINL